MAHVFLSYVHENENDVIRLSNDLIKHGIRVWLDRKDIKPGAKWQDAIREAIRKGDFFIACFSKQYGNKGKSYMNEELTLAIEQLRQYANDRKWFLPVLITDCEIPDRAIGAGETLRDIQYLPLYQDWEEGIRRLVATIKGEGDDSFHEVSGGVITTEGTSDILPSFLDDVVAYIEKDEQDRSKEVIFAGISLSDVMLKYPQYEAQLASIIALSNERECSLRFVLTHPMYAHVYEEEESREPDGIVREILHNIKWLESHGVSSADIRLQRAVSIRLMISSTERMLLIPFAFGRGATPFTEVRNARREQSTFREYWIRYYERPWHCGWQNSRGYNPHFIERTAFPYVHQRLHSIAEQTGPGDANSRVTGEYFCIHGPPVYVAIFIWLDYRRACIGTVLSNQNCLVVALQSAATSGEQWTQVGEIQVDDFGRGFCFWHSELSSVRSSKPFSRIGLFHQKLYDQLKRDGQRANEVYGFAPVLWASFPDWPNEQRGPIG
jgi:hypothetical protein